ncbi:hypothetical protein [Hymenobacter koreensis]|uniref:Uncharacterized protein n=1 Tax=Hymenobacter koreensis TaxID=1084523 RepID=A0ABP8JNN3_9BACT
MANIQFLPASRSLLRPTAGTDTPPPGFAGPVPGQNITATDSRWSVTAGALEADLYNGPEYLSQPIRYFNASPGGGVREILCYIGANGLEIFCGDTAPIGLDYLIRSSPDDVLLATVTVLVNTNQYGGVNTKVGTLAPGAVPPGVYLIRAVQLADKLGVFDTIKLLA